jgi:hypothetical protein
MDTRRAETISSAIKNELNSPQAMVRFENLLDRYYKSSNDLNVKLDQFNQLILQNQEQITILLKQIVDGAVSECPNNPNLEIIKEWMEDLLFGDEYKLKQQVRDLLESGMARKLRNFVITYITITAIIAMASAFIGYFFVAKNVSKSILDDIGRGRIVYDSSYTRQR